MPDPDYRSLAARLAAALAPAACGYYTREDRIAMFDALRDAEAAGVYRTPDRLAPFLSAFQRCTTEPDATGC